MIEVAGLIHNTQRRRGTNRTGLIMSKNSSDFSLPPDAEARQEMLNNSDQKKTKPSDK